MRSFSGWLSGIISSQNARRRFRDSSIRRRRAALLQSLESRQLLAANPLGSGLTSSLNESCPAIFAPAETPVAPLSVQSSLLLDDNAATPIAALVFIDPAASVSAGTVNLMVPERPTVDILSDTAAVLDSFQVRLDEQPTANVNVTFNPNSQLSVNGAAADASVVLTFTSVNWNTPQTVTVAAADDAAVEGDHTGTIAVSIASSDNRFSSLVIPNLSVSIIDDDAPNTNVVINEVLFNPAGEVDASGNGTVSSTNDEFVEILNASDVAIDISGWTLSDATDVRHTFAVNTILAGGQAILVFGGGPLSGPYGNSLAVAASTGTLNLGNTDDTVVLRSPSQAIDAVFFTADMTDAASLARSPDATGPFDDSNFLTVFVEAATPGLSNATGGLFDIIPGVLVSTTGGSNAVNETGPTSDTLSVVLTRQPLQDVVVAVGTVDGQTNASPTSLTFTTANWNIPRTLTITAVDDSLTEAVHTGSVTFTTTSVDPEYDQLAINPVEFTITDNDELETIPPRALIVTPSLTKISDAAIGTFDLVVRFNEPMNTSVNPLLTFPVESPASSISFASGTWLNNTDYRARYNLLASDVVVPNVDVNVVGGQDLANNFGSSITLRDVFSIDTIGELVAYDLLNSTSSNRTSFVLNPSTPFTNPADAFGIYRVGTTPVIPPVLIDESLVAVPADLIGVIGESNTHQFLGAANTRNPNTTATGGEVTATWTFNIAGFADLQFLADIAAMGDFETDDTFLITAQVDGGPQVEVLELISNQSGTLFYTSASGNLLQLDDPMQAGALTLNNVLQTVTSSISGTGSVLTLRLFTNLSQSNEAIALQNLMIKGTAAVVTPATVVGVVVNDGSVTRSQITSLTVTFDRVVDPTLLQNAFTITNIDRTTNNVVSGLQVSSTVVNDRTVATLTFATGGNLIVNRAGTGLLANSLTNGNYRLNIDAANVVVLGTTIPMAANYVYGGQTKDQPGDVKFYRLLADINADGALNNADIAAVVNLFQNNAYRPDLDTDGNGIINNADLAALSTVILNGSRRL